MKTGRSVKRYPAGTIAFYGPDDRWFVDAGDVRADEAIFAEIATFLREHGVNSVAMTDRIDTN